MNALIPIPRPVEPLDPFLDPIDALLGEIAINSQLPPGLFAKAGRRYVAVREYVERDGSPLAGLVLRFYPQGSMAIDATISTRGTDDEYDLDIVAELAVPDWYTPEQRLDVLEQALRGYPVAARIERQSRCITVRYADGMHLDITPSRRLQTSKERESHISHAKKGSPAHEHCFVPMNAWAFAQWYRDRTPLEPKFALAFNKRLYDAAGIAFAAAEVEEIPEQTPLIVKSVTTVALQLIKRFRNVLYANLSGRMPPSVLLSCHAGHAARQGMSLSGMVIRQARWTARAIDDAARLGQLLDVRNPEWREDRFTDRWPENQVQQKQFARELHDLADGLEALRHGNVQLEDLKGWLRSRFGDLVVSKSINAFNNRNGRAIRSSGQRYTLSGGLIVPAKPALVSAAAIVSPVAARAHTNMGERR